MTLHILPPRWRRALEILPRSLQIKTAAILLLIPAFILLTGETSSLLKQNEMMFKYIRNSRTIQARFDALTSVRDSYKGFIAERPKDADPESLKSEHIQQLLALISQNALKTDSYHAETLERNGCLIFRYNIAIIGKFTDVLGFFDLLPQQPQRYFVHSYDIELHQETQVRMGLRVEVPTERK